MANKIIVLEEDIVSKIAAGEVVERPASVVKELLENALDAQSSQVSFEIKDGGKRLIKVSDDGWGMSSSDAKLALLRHSTSKIKSLGDLFSISTLGFRGEALPSIAAVSYLELVSREKDSLEGVKVKAEGGKILEVKKIGCPPGTEVLIRDLFYNTPARLKYLKTASTEIAHISKVVTTQALSHPQVSFKLVHNGMTIFNSPSTPTPYQAVIDVYGKDLAKDLLELEFTHPSLDIKGFIGKPSISRASRAHQTFFVNSRPVRSKILFHALGEAYQGLIPGGRHPLAILELKIRPELIDVNVHPAKLEVRFLREKEVHNLVQEAIRKCLTSAQLIPELRLKEPLPQKEVGSYPRAERKYQFVQETSPTLSLREVREEYQRGRPSFEEIAVLGQVFQTYLLAEDKDEFLIIDQHALHERIIFEELMKTKKSSGVPSQSLLIPLTLQLEPKQALSLKENLNSLKEIGFVLEDFGGNTFIIRAVPSVLKVENEQILFDLIDEISEESLQSKERITWEKIIQMVACKAAVKAGENLSRREAEALLKEFQNLENPFSCPHGRPTVIRMKKSDLERQFGRR